jgi:Tfp pilus assembly protein PilE
MKTDNFDEAFRRKVESFHPPFRDDEIDRIQGYVNKHIPLSFWQRFGHTFTYTLGSIVIVSLLSTIIYQAYENKTLLSKISDLTNKLEQKQVAIATKDTPKNIVIEKIDTVFVTKYIPKQASDNDNIVGNNSGEQIAHLNQSAEPIFGAVANENQKTIRQSETTKPVISDKTIEDLPELKSEESDVKKSVNPIEQTNIIAKQKQEGRDKASDKKKLTNVSSESVANDSRQQPMSLSNETPNGASIISERPLIISSVFPVKSLIVNELNRKPYTINDWRNINDLSNRKFYVPNFPIQTKGHKSFRFPSITMPTLKYRVGLGLNAGYGQLGPSLLTDILFAKRWSLTSGINMSLLGFERFGDEDDFKRKTDKDFRNEHPSNLPIGGSIEDIEEHQLLFRVPIYLNYRYPLRKDYTLLLTTGTDLDIHLKQFTSYSHYDFFVDEEYKGIEEKIPVVPFNNWMFSVGAEKRWSRFAIQFSPYFNYQFKRLSYRNDNFTFGFKLNGFYRLSR